MQTLLLEEDIATADSAAMGTVTRGMLRQRAVELALRNGRSAQTVSKSDWEQAKRELMMNRTHPRGRPPLKEPELERWENEGGVIPGTAEEYS